MKKLEYEEVPWCCTAVMLVNFSGDSVPVMRADLREAINAARGEDDFDGYIEGENGVLIAVTTTLQKKGNLALKREGFICSDPLYKKRHPESQLLVWHRPLIDAKGNNI
jgi:hypothetical protein